MPMINTYQSNMKRLRKQFALHKVSNFKITIEGFLISLIILGIPLNLYKNRFYDNSWTVGEWLISYSGGFIRRGLPGQVIFYLSSNLNINPIFLTWLISVSSIFFLFILVRIFSWRTFDKTFLLSSLILLGPISEDYLVRKDVFLVLLYGVCLLTLKKLYLKKISTSLSILLINFFSIIALLSHEGYGIWALPSLYLLIFFYIRKFLINNLKSLLTSFILITPSILIFIICIIFKGNKNSAIAIHNSWKEFKDVMPSTGLLDSVYPDGAIAWIGESLNTTFQLSISSLGKFNLIIFWHPLMWAITIFFAIRLYCGMKQDPFFNLKKLFILIQLIPFTPLFIIAHDYGRWIFIWLTSSCLLFSLIIKIFKKESIQLEEKVKKIKTLNKLFPVIKNQRNYNTIILLLGLPHCCWSVGRYLISNPIGFSIKNFIFYTSLILN